MRRNRGAAASEIPRDDSLPALQALRSGALTSFLTDSGLRASDMHVHVLKHHPGSRCSLRLSAGGSNLVVKAYSEDVSPLLEVHDVLRAAGLATGRGPTVPRIRNHEPSLFVISMEWLSGSGGKSAIERGGDRAGRLAAEWLRAGSRVGYEAAPSYGPANFVRLGERWASTLRVAQPELGVAMKEVCDALTTHPPRSSPETLRHGSFSLSHVIDLGDGPGVIDWDSFRKGRVELDAGHYLAYLSRFAGGRSRLSEQCAEAANAFKSSLGDLTDAFDLRWFKAAGLMRLAWYLTHHRPNRWHERAQALLAEAAGELGDAQIAS